MASPLVGASLETGLNYMAYEQSLSFLRGLENPVWSTSAAVFAAGSAAGCVIGSVLTPIELIKCRMQMDTQKHYMVSRKSLLSRLLGLSLLSACSCSTFARLSDHLHRIVPTNGRALGIV